MNPCEMATRNIRPELAREITRYGGMNPHGAPLWRVVWAENVKEQSFGQMRHMPRIAADCDLNMAEVEPERFESGELWIPRYSERGAILERWFPASVWGSQMDWEQELAEDGQTRLKGAWPRHGDYFMVGDEFLKTMPPAGYWKGQIQKELRRQQNAPTDPGTYLATLLYIERATNQARGEAFAEEVNHIHRNNVEPLLATVSTTAQRLRDELMMEMGMDGHLAAG